MDTLLQWNCRGLKHNFNELKLLISAHNPIAICLQETYLKESENLNVKNYSLYNYYANQENGKASGGVSILIRNDIAHKEIDINTNLQVKAVTLTTNKQFTLCSVYLPPQKRVDGAELDNIIQQLPGAYMLLGDFNAHNTLWGCRNINNKGKMMEDFIGRNEIVFLNNKEPTYIHPGFKTLSTLDLALCHPTLGLDFNFSVLSDLYGSDHFPVILTSSVSDSGEKLPHWNFKKADWAKYEALSLINFTLTADLDMERFTSNLHDLAEECIPKTSARSSKPKYPWFNDDCKTAIKNRVKLLDIFKKSPTSNNLLNYKLAYAKARRTIRRAKKESWKSYVSKLNSRSPIKKTWEMIRKISGKFSSSPVRYLETDQGRATSKKEIADTLGASFAKNSSSDNYTDSFRKYQEQAERKNLNFKSDNNEIYNTPFTFKELETALSGAKDSAAGPDDIHYLLIKHLAKPAKETLLSLYNDIFRGNRPFPPEWRRATVIPIAKPGKDPIQPGSYRPIALTSCLCKILEKIVNNRLVWYLEKNHIITPFQAGFRKNRSTNDQLIRFETLLKDAFIKNDHVVSVFFDLEKAYDTTWKYGILKDMHDHGLRGHLPLFIENFLKDRSFNVRIGTSISDNFIQEMGVPQGSILSPTLFSIKINSIVKVLTQDIDPSLYVDDFLISYKSKNLNSIERKLQLTLKKLEKWCNENGFKFSSSKTICTHFTKSRKIFADPELYINGAKIQVKNEVKFLGVFFDKKLTFAPHIKYLKNKCLKAMNLLKVVSRTDWGGDRKVLLHLYRSLIRSKIDYGSIVYGSACKTTLQMLDPIAHQGLRLALGAFRTSPIQSLYTEANEPPLKLRREKLALQYTLKIAAHPDNPTYKYVFDPKFERLYNTKKKTVPSFGLRIRPILKRVGFQQDRTIKETPPNIPPWTLATPTINFDMTKKTKKSETAETIYNSMFSDIRIQHPGYKPIYTDGSKTNEAVAAAAVRVDKSITETYNKNVSIFTAEIRAIEIALNEINTCQESKHIIFTDSKSALQAIQDIWTPNPLVRRVLELHNKLRKTKDIIFCWVPSHAGIRGNEAADRTAKAALESPVSNAMVPASDWLPKASQYVKEIRNENWDKIIDNKLKEIVPNLTEHNQLQCANRRDEVVLTRLRIGHSRLTHSYLMAGDPAPVCVACDAPFTIKHILLDCVDFADIRRLFYECQNIFNLFKSVAKDKILGFIREIGLYHKI